MKSLKSKLNKLLNKDKIDLMELNIKSINENLDTLDKKINFRMDIIQKQNHEQLVQLDYSSKKYSFVYWKQKLIHDTSYKILIAGYYGALNCGDELMLQTIIKYLEKKDNKVNFYIMLYKNENLFPCDLYPNIKYIYYPETIEDFELISDNFDAVFFGGGAHIDDRYCDFTKYGFSFPIIHTKLSKLFIQKNKKVITFGFSSNNFLSNENYINDLKYIVNNSWFSVRDSYSEALLYKYNICKKINVVNDIVLADYDLMNAKIIKNSKDNKILLILIYNEETYNKNVNLIKYLLSKKIEVHLLPFYQYNNNDHNYIDKIVKEIKNENLYLYNYPYNMKNLIKLILKFNKIISCRYHSTLISLILNRDVLSLTYDIHPHYINKIEGIYKKYNIKKEEILFSELENKKNKIDEWINSVNENCFSTDVLKESSKELNNYIDKLMER